MSTKTKNKGASRRKPNQIDPIRLLADKDGVDRSLDTDKKGYQLLSYQLYTHDE